MWIKKFFIKAFGHFSNLETDELSPGFNLIYGQNEAGKTSFMNFIKGLFYGFDKSYRLPGSTAHGGQMTIVMGHKDQLDLEVSRYGYDARTRELKVLDKEGHDQTELYKREVDKLSLESFNLVYWLTHRDIYELDLKGDDLSGQLYSSAFGLGGKAYKNIIKVLEAENRKLFTGRGQNQEINALLADIEQIQAGLERAQAEQISYQSYLEELENLELDLAANDNQLRDLRKDLSHQEKLASVYETYREIGQLDTDRDNLGQSVNLATWSEQAAEIEYRLSQEKQIQDLVDRIAKGEEEIKGLVSQRENVLLSHGLDWDLEDIKKFPIDKGQADLVRKFQQQKLSLANRIASKEEDILRQERDQGQSHMRSREIKKGTLARILAFGPASLALIFFIFAFIQGDNLNQVGPGLGTGLMLLALVIFLVLTLGTGLRLWQSRLEEIESLRAGEAARQFEAQSLREARADLEVLQREEAKVKADWQTELATYRLKGHNSEETILDLIRDLEPIHRGIKREEEIKDDLTRLKSELGDYQGKLRDLFASIDREGKYEGQLGDWGFILDKLKAWQGQIDDLDKARAENINIIKRISQSGSYYEEVMADLAQSQQAEIEDKILDLKMRIKDLEDIKEVKTVAKGRVSGQIKNIQEDEEVLKYNLDLEKAKTKLKGLVDEWMINTSISWVLNEAKTEYQNEYQPDIIKEAGDIFASFTQGRYQKLKLDLEEDLIMVLRTDGQWVKVEDLSQGTREQVYIAMRLAFVKEMSKATIDLPLFVDDILASADEGRMRAGLDLLIKWGQDQQVLFFTCHDHIYRACQEIISQANKNRTADDKELGLEAKIFCLDQVTFKEI